MQSPEAEKKKENTFLVTTCVGSRFASQCEVVQFRSHLSGEIAFEGSFVMSVGQLFLHFLSSSSPVLNSP